MTKVLLKGHNSTYERICKEKNDALLKIVGHWLNDELAELLKRPNIMKIPNIMKPNYTNRGRKQKSQNLKIQHCTKTVTAMPLQPQQPPQANDECRHHPLKPSGSFAVATCQDTHLDLCLVSKTLHQQH